MGSFKWALSWLIVLGIGLAPMLVYFVARVIGQARQRKTRESAARIALEKTTEPSDTLKFTRQSCSTSTEVDE